MSYQSVETQQFWGNIAAYHTGDKLYSYQWGNPNETETKNVQGRILGNYKKIKVTYLVPHIIGKTVIDLGSFDGKWTTFMKPAKQIVCVDINAMGFPGIRDRLYDYNLRFALTNGADLSEIETDSVDFIFSMDSLVRSEIALITGYFKEFKRVLKSDGKACIHLPCQSQVDSREMDFTPLTEQQISDAMTEAGFGDFRLDKETVKHGALLLIGYGKF